MLAGYQRKTKPALWCGTILDKRPKISTKTKTPPARKPIKRTQRPIASVSKAKRSERTAYRIEARAAVAAAIQRGDRCPVVNTIPELRDGFRYGHKISNK